jgi:hypothetical protein
MPSERKQVLERASAESWAHISAAHASIAITRDHVSSSRNAIARSLALLSRHRWLSED